MGGFINELKIFISIKINKESDKFANKKNHKSKIDFSLPSKKYIIGYQHPLTKTIRKIESIFEACAVKISLLESPIIKH